MNKQTYITNNINYLLNDNNTTDTTSYKNGSLGNSLSSFINNLNSKNNIYYSTGINSIDELLGGGLSPQTITILGGVCGVGKTTLTLQIAWFISQHYQKDVLFLATEMSEFQLQVKLLSNLSAQIVQELNVEAKPLTYDDIRIENMKAIGELDFAGYAIGGLAVGESAEEMYRIIDAVEPYMPKEKPTLHPKNTS